MVIATSIASTTIPAASKVVAAATPLAATFISVSIAARGLDLIDGDAPAVEILVVHPLIASLMDFSLMKVTNPKPRELLISRSLMTYRCRSERGA
ncbi:hypothetical protein CRG98_019396 [Punica granatum]|uniref:Uncharacterized protein n=1 Tax=Punica granatum TaxID=22663 RepID=A0A2I0JV64_PUNGR|nr:hypothetical protein CRG98_019396 [Punica granatum]